MLFASSGHRNHCMEYTGQNDSLSPSLKYFHWQQQLRQNHGYCQTSNIRWFKSLNLNVSRLVLQFPLPNPLKLGAKSRFTMYPDNKVHGANMGPIWGRQDPDWPHVGPVNFAIWVVWTEPTCDATTTFEWSAFLLPTKVRRILEVGGVSDLAPCLPRLPAFIA